MNFLLTLALFTGFLALLGIGYIVSRKALQKGCSVDPDSCSCRQEGKDPSTCDK